MKKHLISVFIISLAVLLFVSAGPAFSIGEEPIPLDEAHFPDPVFRACISDLCDQDRNNLLDEVELMLCDKLTVNEDVKSVQGIEFLAYLKLLIFENCRMKELDLPDLPSVDIMDIKAEEELKSVYIGKTPLMRQFLIDAPGLTELILEDAPKLNNTHIMNTKIRKLDLSEFPALEFLYLTYTDMEEIDISHNPLLENMFLYRMKIGQLDVRKNTQLKQIGVDYCNLTSIDVTNNPLLERLSVAGCRLTELDVSQNSHLNWLYVEDNQIASIRLHPDAPLESMSLTNNKILSIDVSAYPLLKDLRLQNNPVSALDVTHNPELKVLHIDATAISHIDLSKNPLLEELRVEACSNMRALDLRNNPELRILLAYWTQIESLDLSQNTKLEQINAKGSKLSHLDLTHCLKAPETEIYGNVHLVRISPADRTFDLTELPGFDPSRASGWEGGSVNGNILTFNNNEVRYIYDCGHGISETFNLKPGGKSPDGFTYYLQDDGTICITDCTASGNVVIPSVIDGYTVTRLNNNLFSYRSGVTSVTLPATLEHLGSTDDSNLLAYVFASCPDLQAVNVAEGNPFFKSEDGVLYSADGSILYVFPTGKKGDFDVPKTVTWMDCMAFSDVKGTRTVYIRNKDASWALNNFWGLEDTTVYYVLGGRTADNVLGIISEEGYTPGDYGATFVAVEDEEEREALAEKAGAIIREVITENMTVTEKALALHDWIITHAHYSMKYNDAYGIFFYGEAQCEGYSRTYQMLLNLAGIENRLVIGRAGDTQLSAEGHMWNQISIDGIWYHVDCTWDDPAEKDADGNFTGRPVSGMEHHGYFMVSTQRIAKDHYWKTNNLSGWYPEEDGMTYHDENGKRITGWLTVDEETFYFDTNGLNKVGTVRIDGIPYSFVKVKIYTDKNGDHYAGALPKAPDSFGRTLSLPSVLTAIEEEAFAGISTEAVYLPEKLEFIGSRAFADMQEETYIFVNAGIKSIAADAFENSHVIFVISGSMPEILADFLRGCGSNFSVMWK